MFKKFNITACFLSLSILLGICFAANISSAASPLYQSAEIVDSAHAVYADEVCTGKRAGSVSPNSNVPDTAGIMSKQILEGMQKFLRLIYMELSKVFMLGNALLCYATKVANTEFLGILNIPDLGFLICGAVIYVVAAFMTFSIGMYFVDISFKLGFAMLFFPISVALWPFSPTQSKLTDNLSIIIRNSMLFVLVSVGVAYAVMLISNGVFEGGWESFWDAIESQQTELLSENFSLSSIHILIVAFSLIYGLKILASSVNDYLDSLFNDAVFGSSSPMHHMATQVGGTIAENTLKPAAAFVGDVARVAAGKAIVGGVDLASKMTSKEGRQELATQAAGKARALGNAAQSMVKPLRNPVEAYHNAQAAIGKGLNKAVHGIGNFNKNVVWAATLAVPNGKKRLNILDNYEKKRVERNDKIGNWLEQNVPGALERGAKGVVTSAATGIHNMNNPGDIVSKEEMRSRLHNKKEKVINSVDGAVTAIDKGIADAAGKVGEAASNIASSAGQFIAGAAQGIGRGIEQGAKQAVTGAAMVVNNAAASIGGNAERRTDMEGMRAKLHQDKEKVKAYLKELYQTSDQAHITLQPSAVLSAPLKAAVAAVPFNWGDTFKRIRQIKNEIKNDAQSQPHFILKRSGQIVMRTIKGTVQDVKGLGSFAGNALRDFGKGLQDNTERHAERMRQREQNMSYKERQEAQEQAERDERDLYRSLSDN
ncbi:MAG: hypothetical protein J6039_03790 [Alphaproteobacteria bacterium]|nr:hypothetical protein [Alphaproteobacteria bacterium]